jgi:uncharacterized protein YggE
MEERYQRASERNVTVRGVGVARVRPDGVIVGLGVQHRSDAAAEALNETARKAEQLESLFRELEIGEEDWLVGSVTLQEHQEWDESSRREVRQGYIASSRVEVRLSDGSRLGTLLGEAAARVEASVSGPQWEVRPENPAHDEARSRAIADARRRADAYAQAAGLSLGEVREIVEAGGEQDADVMRGGYAVAMSASKAAFRMPIHSEGLEIVAGVRVTYELVPR